MCSQRRGLKRKNQNGLDRVGGVIEAAGVRACVPHFSILALVTNGTKRMEGEKSLMALKRMKRSKMITPPRNGDFKAFTECLSGFSPKIVGGKGGKSLKEVLR